MPEILPDKNPLILLYGPNNLGWDWRNRALGLIKRWDCEDEIYVINPKEGLVHGFSSLDLIRWTEGYEKQARAKPNGVSLFWLENHGHSKRLNPSFWVTLGEALTYNRFWGSKLVIGMDQGVSNQLEEVNARLERIPHIKIASSLKELCQQAVDQAKGKFPYPYPVLSQTGLTEDTK